MRRVVSLFLPTWPTDCWQRGRSPRQDAPDQPLVLAGHDGRKLTLTASDRAASALGFHPGLTLAEARARLPTITVGEADPQADERALRQLAAWCLRLTPLAAASPPDGIWLDITGASHLQGGEHRLLDRLLRRLGRAGIAGRAAIATTPGAAHALARYAEAPITVLAADDEAEALAPLPLAGLRLDAPTLTGLRRLGITTIAGLAGLPRAPLANRFGPLPGLRLDQALGRAAETIQPIAPPDRLAERLVFTEPLLDAEAFAAVIERLVPPLCRRLEARGEGARRLTLGFQRLDRATATIRIGTAIPTRDARHLVRLLIERLESLDPGEGVEAMELVVHRADTLTPRQEATLLGGAAREHGLPALIDRLANRLGEGAIHRVAPTVSDIPERSRQRLVPLAPATGETWPAHLPRPLRLFEPPQPVTTLATMPGHAPSAFTWRRVRHRVRRADGPERIFGEWWRRASEAEALRDYWAVEDESGRRFWLFRRGEGMDWYLHGVF